MGELIPFPLPKKQTKPKQNLSLKILVMLLNQIFLHLKRGSMYKIKETLYRHIFLKVHQKLLLEVK
jgi:hypothetical protein